MAAAGPSNAFQHARSPLMEASIKMAEQLAPNRRSDRGRMHGLADEGFDAGPFPQADGDHPPALQLAALERGRSSKSSTRLQGSRGALAMVHVRPKRPSMAPLRERWRGCTGPLGAAGRPLRPNWLGKRLPRGGDR